MYKVFFNNRILAIVSPETVLPESSVIHLIDSQNREEVLKIVNHFLKSEDKNTYLLCRKKEEIWRKVKSCFLNIQAAGGVVRKDDKFLFIFRRGKWDLPKGKIDKGETPEQAALREVSEECGIKKLIIKKQLPSTWHVYQSEYKNTKNHWILKETIWYEMEHWGNEKLIPQEDEDITKIEWFSPEDFNVILENTYPNLEQIIRRYL